MCNTVDAQSLRLNLVTWLAQRPDQRSFAFKRRMSEAERPPPVLVSRPTAVLSEVILLCQQVGRSWALSWELQPGNALRRHLWGNSPRRLPFAKDVHKSSCELGWRQQDLVLTETAGDVSLILFIPYPGTENWLELIACKPPNFGLKDAWALLPESWELPGSSQECLTSCTAAATAAPSAKSISLKPLSSAPGRIDRKSEQI